MIVFIQWHDQIKSHDVLEPKKDVPNLETDSVFMATLNLQLEKYEGSPHKS